MGSVDTVAWFLARIVGGVGVFPGNDSKRTVISSTGGI